MYTKVENLWIKHFNKSVAAFCCELISGLFNYIGSAYVSAKHRLSGHRTRIFGSLMYTYICMCSRQVSKMSEYMYMQIR